MINTCLSISAENDSLEPFEDRIDILFRELELATKWQRPSVLLAVYSSEYVRKDVDAALENRLQSLGQRTRHIKIKNQKDADVSIQISKSANLDDVVFFVEGLRWGINHDDYYAYHVLNNRSEFFLENQIRVVFWLTEKEAFDLAHHAPDYWAFRHRVIEFVDSPKPDQISPHILESAWQGVAEFTYTTEDLDAKIALRTALLNDLPTENESTSTRAHLLLTLGMLHWRRGDYERAIQFLNTALDLTARLEDNSFEALCFNAIALVETDQGQVEEAIQAFQNAVALAPDQISPWNNLGHLYKKLARHPEALAAFQKAIEHNASDAQGWNGLGDVYHEAGQNDDAIFSYLKAIEFSPDYARSWCGLGNCYMSEGQLDEALAAHQKAIEIDRHTINSWLGLGNIYRMQGDNANAGMSFRTALELDPRNAQVWNELGNFYYQTGAHNEAMHSYQKGIEFNQGGELSYSNMASIYIQKGRYAEAIPLIHKAIEFSDDKAKTASLWNLLGDANRRLDDYDNALAAYREADTLDPDIALSRSESPTTKPDPNVIPVDQISAQPAAHLEPDPVNEETLPPESSKPAMASSPEGTLARDTADTISTRPDTEFMDWWEGLASVMPFLAPSEKTVTTGSNPIETCDIDKTEEIPEFQSTPQENAEEFQPEAACEPRNTNEPSDPFEAETYNSNEPLPEIPDSHIHSELPVKDDDLDTSLQGWESVKTEDADTVLSNDENDATMDKETAVIDNLTSQYSNVEDTCQNQVTIDQKNAQIWNELGNVYYKTGAFEEAMHAFEMAIELDRSCGWSYNNLASIYFHQKHYADAISLYQKGLQLLHDDKDKALLWNRLGDTYRRLHEHDQATVAYRKAIELDPDNVSLLTRARFSLLGNLRA